MLQCFRNSYFIATFTVVNLTEIATNCTNQSFGLYCTNLNTYNESEISRLEIKGNGSNNVKYVFLRNSYGSIGEHTFIEYPQIDSVDIQFCSIKNIATHIETLQKLYLIKNLEFPDITDTMMKHFPGLKILYISDNQQLNIQNSAFKHTRNLQHLTIRGQEISTLGNNFLEGLVELTFLDLKGNGIQQIEENVFISIKNLSHLILSDNKFVNFKQNTFTSLSNLESLELIGNDLSTLDSTLFRSQGELKYIGIPSEIVRKKIELKQLTGIFKKLESIGLSYNDQNDTDVNAFIILCKNSGFEVKLVEITE